MAGATLLERELNEKDQRTAKVREVAYEEAQQAKEEYAGYDIARAMESVRTSSAMPAMPAPQQPVNQTVTPEAPMRSKELFSDYVYKNGELLRKSPDSDMMIPVFETVKNIVEEQYFDIPDYTPMEANTAEVEAVEYEEEEDDALPTRRTMETVIRPAAALMEMETTETRTGFRATFAALSTKMKVAIIAVFSAILLAIALICINSSVLRSLDSDLNNLKGRAAQERSTYEALKEESDLYTDPDSEIVREWAENNGMTK